MVQSSSMRQGERDALSRTYVQIWETSSTATFHAVLSLTACTKRQPYAQHNGISSDSLSAWIGKIMCETVPCKIFNNFLENRLWKHENKTSVAMRLPPQLCIQFFHRSWRFQAESTLNKAGERRLASRLVEPNCTRQNCKQLIAKFYWNFK